MKLMTAGFIINSLFLVSLVPPVAARQKVKKTVSAKSEDGKLSEQALNQIKALNAEKESRTPAQQKVDSQLLYAAKMQRGEAIADGVDKLETGVKVDEKGLTLVNFFGSRWHDDNSGLRFVRLQWRSCPAKTGCNGCRRSKLAHRVQLSLIRSAISASRMSKSAAPTSFKPRAKA